MLQYIMVFGIEFKLDAFKNKDNVVYPKSNFNKRIWIQLMSNYCLTILKNSKNYKLKRINSK